MQIPKLSILYEFNKCDPILENHRHNDVHFSNSIFIIYRDRWAGQVTAFQVTVSHHGYTALDSWQEN